MSNARNLSNDQIEQAIADKGLNAPRVTPGRLDSKIANARYHVFPGTTVTVCLLTLENGFNLVGESAAVSPENFDEEIGRNVAYRHARDQMWKLEGYLLREDLHRENL